MLVWLAGLRAGAGLPDRWPCVVAMRSFTGIVNPLARVMAAADAVAEGDFSVRVPEATARASSAGWRSPSTAWWPSWSAPTSCAAT